MKKILDIDFRRYESINFGLDGSSHIPNLIYHFTRQTRGPKMKIQTVDRLGYHLGVIRKGSAVFQKGSIRQPLEYGSVFFVQQNEWYELYKTDPEEIELTLIMFDPSIQNLWNRFIGSRTRIVPEHPAHIISITDLFFEHLHRIPEKRIERSNAFAPVLLQILSSEDHLQTEDYSPEKKLYLKCLRYIQTHYMTLRTVDEIPSACAISRCRLFELFRKYNGKTPRVYLEQLKIEASQSYLLLMDWPIDRIAEEMHYEDVGTFTKAFNRITGMPPGRWRKRFHTP